MKTTPFRSLLILLAFFYPNSASSQTQTISQMLHSTWSGHDGSPLGIRALTIGPDGLLYLAGMSGLYRFDGVTFEPVTISGVEIESSMNEIFFTQSGELLLVLSHGAPVLLGKSHAEQLASTDTSPIEKISRPCQAPDGTIYALLNERELVALGRDRVWHKVLLSGLPGGHITHLEVDKQGSIWIVIADQLYRKAKNGTFAATGAAFYGRGKFTAGAHGDLWLASSGPATADTPARHLQHFDRFGQALPVRDVVEPLTAVSPTKDGFLWLLTTESKLAHVALSQLPGGGPLRLSQAEDHLDLRTAVRNDGANAFFPAADGSLWIGGYGGVERFQKSAVVPLVPGATPGSWQHCSEPNGSHWVIDAHDALYLLADGRKQFIQGDVDVLQCSPYGNLLVTNAGLAVLQDGRSRALPSIPGLQGYSNHYIFTGATRTSDGVIVAATAGAALGRSLWTYRSGLWRRVPSPPDQAEVSGMFAAPNGEVYLGFRDGSIEVLNLSRTTFKSLGRIFQSSILGFASSNKGLLAYGVDGIAFEKGEYFIPLRFADAPSARFVSGVGQSANEDLWMSSTPGIVRVAASEFAEGIRDPTHKLLTNILSEGNYSGPAPLNLFSQSIQVDKRQKLWFDTLNGVVTVIPELLNVSNRLPLVIKSITADGKPLPPDRKLPPGINTLSIRYIGIDFSAPASLTYAYKLDGYDSTWQEAGRRTEALYTHLHAGSYRFALKARNTWGTWTPAVTLAPFDVRPHVYETTWFSIVSLLVVASLVWLGIWLRLRVVSAQIKRRAEERADERILIARDLHDTLLQGVQGLLLSFHAAIEAVPAQHHSRADLERALTSAEKLIVEGRDRVKGLRSSRISGEDLPQLLKAVADDLGSRDRFNLTVSQANDRLLLRDDVAAELFLVGREAILNAVRHASALHIQVSLVFEQKAFTLEVRDDGVGFANPGKSGQKQQRQWGIPGMGERVTAMGGQLNIRSSANAGTFLSVKIRRKLAYV